jgi:menaquinone reductase, molybdopterin-binding-like subunit
MDRRNFFKIVSTVSAGVATTACEKNRDPLIPLLVPEHPIPPGAEQWHPSVCSECAAGCGVIVRVMEGERVIERHGEKFRERIACVKKIEGNPLDPVSGGRLCARGHAALQSLYNPDRVRGPMRTAARGRGEFAPFTWNEAVALAADKLGKVRSVDPRNIVFLTTPQAGTRALTIKRFLDSLDAPHALTCSVAALAPERKAAEVVFGWKGLPRYDLGQARYVLGVGADFLGGWASPVYYSRQFGHFRQGRAGIRGKLVHAESRMSLTASSADEWLPVRPGAEPHFLVAVARLLLDGNLARNMDQVPAGVHESIRTADFPALVRISGIEERRLRRIARELGESESPLVIAGASVVHTNSVDALIAAHFLNLMLGNAGKAGGVFPPHPVAAAQPVNPALENANVLDALKRAQVLLLDGENPVYSLPASSRVSELLAGIETIVSFGSFIDDSAAYADAILPDHHPLESDAAVVPVLAPSSIAINTTAQFVQPLYDTRPLVQTLGDIARKMNIAFEPVTVESFIKPSLPSDRIMEDVVRQGGLWVDVQTEPSAPKPLTEKLQWSDPGFDGAPAQFPLQFQPYPSLQYHDGRAANLPWMQELPDPVSSAMWDLPAEIDPQTAEKLNVTTGDWLRVESPHGSLNAAAYVHPAALPGVVSMAIGQGHAHYGRYASGRGANPLSILAPTLENSTSALAFGATRVRLTRLENKPAELTQFSPGDREQGPWGYR